jgi:hypothetical protein
MLCSHSVGEALECWYRPSSSQMRANIFETGTYRNLEKLLQQIRTVKDQNPNPKVLINKLRLRGLKKLWRDDIIEQLTACHDALSSSDGFNVMTQISPLVPTPEARAAKSKRAKKAVLYSRKRRELEEKVHQVLIEQWHCSCTAKHAEAYLLLQPQSLNDEKFDARYDIWFCGVTETPDHVQTLIWQEADILVCRSQQY